MNGDAKIRRQSPRRRRPDNNKNFFSCEVGVDLSRVGLQWKFDVNRRRSMVPILDLGLGKSSLVMDAPIDWAQSFVNIAAFEKCTEKTSGRRFVFRRHRQVGRFPFAEDA